MTKAQLIATLAGKNDMTKKQVVEFLDTLGAGRVPEAGLPISCGAENPLAIWRRIYTTHFPFVTPENA